jgi:AraC-like DNA-binding protein
VVPAHPWLELVPADAGPVGGGTFARPPDPATVLVFRTTVDGRSDLIVVGPRTRGTYNPATPMRLCVRLAVRAGLGRHLFGVPVHELSDRLTSLVDLWGPDGRRLVDALSGVPDAATALARIGGALRLGQPPRTALLTAAMRALSPGGDPRLARLSALAGHLGVSDRRLRAVFARDLGLSPKQFARIARLRHVLSRSGTGRWAHLARDAGYYDQAHMIGDFRALMGVTPAAFAAGRLPPATPCAAPVEVNHPSWTSA